MKKIIFLSLLFSCVKLISQVNYLNSKQDLKEFLAIQSLLAENRTDDLKTFFLNYNYIAIGDSDESMFMKLDLDGLTKENDIIPVITIMSGGKNEYADNYIEISFLKKQNDKSEILLSLEDCISIKKIIQNLCETGATYPMLSAYDKYKKTNIMNVQKIDRYTYKIYSDDNDPSKISYVKASNFFRMDTINKNKADNIAFFGPGKTILTEMFYFEPIESDVDGKYIYKMQLASWKLKDSQTSEKFNVDFFMSLKNFNDRIWLDK